jgi:hypothetical protein
MGEWRYSSNILDLGNRRRRVVSFTPLPLYPRYSLDRRLGGGGAEAVWTVGRREKSLVPAGKKKRLSNPWPVGIPTELSRLVCCWGYINSCKTSMFHIGLPCGGGVEYLHRSPASRRRRRKGNPVPGGYKYGDLALHGGGVSNLRQ